MGGEGELSGHIKPGDCKEFRTKRKKQICADLASLRERKNWDKETGGNFRSSKFPQHGAMRRSVRRNNRSTNQGERGVVMIAGGRRKNQGGDRRGGERLTALLRGN